MSAGLRVLPGGEALAKAAAEETARALRRAAKERGRALLVLAGGGTPLAAYRLLAGMDLPWPALHLFWGDERMVPHDHPHSNFGAAAASGLTAMVPPENLHPIPAQPDDPDRAARAYREELKRVLGRDAPGFDVVLLGLGGDGHTASLFPGDAALDERRLWVVAVRAPQSASPRVDRVTLTLPALSSGRVVLFLAAGAAKRRALAAVLAGEPLPAGLVRPARPPLWLVDQALGQGLEA